MKPRAVDFISYSVSDMDRSEAFYRDVLGLDIEVPRGEKGTRAHATLWLGHFALWVMNKRRPES